MLTLLLLLSSPAQALSVTSLTYDELPQHIEYKPFKAELRLDGMTIAGRRGDKRAYLEAVLPACPAAEVVERRRKKRWKVGNVLFASSVGGLLVSSFAAPGEQAPLIGFAGLAVVGGAVTLSAASLQPGIRAYNTCAEGSP